jgi:hypothetical protein
MSGKLMRVLPHAVMLAAACALYWAATRIDADTGGRIGPAVWPKAIIVIMGLLCAYEIVKRLVARSDFEAKGLLSGSQLPAAEPEAPGSDHKMLAGGIALIAAYVVAVPWAGFFVTTALFLGIFPWIGGLRRPALSAAIAIAGSFTLVVVFMRVAYISLPLGEGLFRTISLALLRAIGVS